MEATSTPSRTPGAPSYIFTVLFPVIGIILAIVAFSRGQVGPGFALLLTGFVAWVVWIMVLVAASAPA